MCSSVGCKPKSVGLKVDDDINKLRSKSNLTNSTSADNDTVVTDAVAPSNDSASPLTPLLASACVWSIPILYEELDVLSMRFTPANGPNVSVTDTHPTLLTYPLHTQATGGTLNLQLTLNTVSTTALHTPLHTHEDVEVIFCGLLLLYHIIFVQHRENSQINTKKETLY